MYSVVYKNERITYEILLVHRKFINTIDSFNCLKYIKHLYAKTFIAAKV